MIGPERRRAAIYCCIFHGGERQMAASERRDHSVGALGHLRVLDFTGPLGQFCSRVMSDMGADVIKVEPPGGGPARRIAPFAGGTQHPDGSLVFIDRNRGKRSVVFDIDDSSDQKTLRELASRVDIVVEDQQPGHMAARGLGYEDLKAVNAGIVYVSITPFGQTGPNAGYKGGELIAQATGGIMYANGDDAQRPAMAPDDLISNIAGLHGAFGALAAIRHRRISGVGQHVDVSRQEVVLYCQGNYIPRYVTSGRVPRREGRQGAMAGVNLFQCADGGFVSLAPFQPNHFRRLVNDVMHEPALANPQWSETSFRNDDQNRLMINSFIERFAATQKRDELVAIGQSHGVPIVPILTPEEAIALPHNRERGFFRTVNQPGVGPILIPGAPFAMGATPWRLDRPAPTIGQHQTEVSAELSTPSAARVRRPNPTEATSAPGSLAGLRVADFTRAFAGPIATMFLGFLGAQVIKIESGDLEDNRGGGQATFPELNRAKSSATIDTRTAEGKATAKRLVAESDIVVENFRPDVMDRLGLDYETLRQARPDLIMISMPGFGKTGRLKDYLAYGQQIIGTTGLLHLWGHPESPLDVRVKYAFP
ncbi:MAG: CoA transferase, partial [Chloroflexi bacterium]|nr:CoA transferase [Chloroflexota bacterium]